MKLRDLIRIAPREEPKTSAWAMVWGITPDNAKLQLRFQKMPKWYRDMLKKQGIFLGANADFVVHLFLTHTGHWMDLQTAQLFTISE